MQVCHTIASLRAAVAANGGGRTALVPTMGGLHEGHLALVRYARTLAPVVIVSIYVNPLQFSPNEDFADYPRRLQADVAALEGLADIVYAPSDEEMYPQEQTVGITLPPLAELFCGASRPGFFQGVAVVVCKLLNQCQPDVVVFGRKDYQQATLVHLMMAQLNIGTQFALHPTVRAEDGLALSSRNDYLSEDERTRAPLLYATLQHAAGELQKGGDAEQLCADAAQRLNDGGFQCDYFVCRSAADLGELQAGDDAVFLAAAWLGRARLIDNISVSQNGEVL